MALPIFFVDGSIESDTIALGEDTSKHVAQVLRMQAGESLQLTDGKGNLLTAVIKSSHKKQSVVQVTERQFIQREGRHVSIAISLLKNASRFEWFLEKATEIGVWDIVPLACERTERQHFRYERMHGIIVSAMLQSQQVWLPSLHQLTGFSSAVNTSLYPQKLIAHCVEEEKLSLTAFEKNMDAQILIGPEGDFSPAEINEAMAAGYKPVTLGNARLRTETAGVVAATLLCI